MNPFGTFDQLLCHLVGDYCLQSDWMAANKYNRKSVALIHAFFYTLPFFALTRSPAALAFIFVTHFVIDHYKLATYVSWVNNFLAPKWIQPEGQPARRNYAWADCKATGYSPERPVWLTVWLMIIVDNTMHLICNAAALRWL
jgi:hypothetical protein